MTEQEQIEEMEKDIVRSAGLGVYEKVKYLTDLGYRKIDDNCAVITKDDLNIYKKQAVKEFAEKLKEICLQRSEWYGDSDDINDEYLIVGRLCIEDIDELLKEY